MGKLKKQDSELEGRRRKIQKPRALRKDKKELKQKYREIKAAKRTKGDGKVFRGSGD